MSRTKRFFYNTASTGFYQIILMVAGLITPKIMLNYYGSEINGLVSSINQFIVYFNLVEAGLSGAAIFALYKPLAENNHKAINAVVSAAKRFYTQAGYIFVSLTIGLALFYPLYLETNTLTPQRMAALVLILGINGALEFFTLAKYRVILAADQRTYVISLASLAHIIINTFIIVVFGTMKIDVVTLRGIAILSIFSRSLILTIYIRKKYKYLSYSEIPNFEALNKRWDALYLQILGAVHMGSPIILLTVLTQNLKLVSVYTIFNMIIGALNGILGIFVSGLSSGFGDVIAKKENNVLERAYSEFEFVYYALISIVYSIAFVTIMPFIDIYTQGVTDINYSQPVVGFLFVLNGILYNIKTPQGMLVISAGLFKETRIQTTVQGGIMLIFGALLTPYFGIVGVLVASIFSNLYRDIDLLFFIPKKLTRLPVKTTFLRVARIFSSIVLVGLPFYFFELLPTGYFEWILNAVLVSIYSVIVVVSTNFIFEKKIMMNTMNRVFGLLNR